MPLMQLLVLIIIVYLCTYVLIDRICRCVENCALAKAYAETQVEMSKVKDDIDNNFGKISNDNITLYQNK